jgi:hypothetical protein
VIDWQNERTYPLGRARLWFPRRRRGKRPSIQTMYRWSSAGYRGIVLETVQVGSTRCTSREACARFVERVSALAGPVGGSPEPDSPTSRQDVEEALAEAGFIRPSRTALSGKRICEPK